MLLYTGDGGKLQRGGPREVRRLPGMIEHPQSIALMFLIELYVDGLECSFLRGGDTRGRRRVDGRKGEKRQGEQGGKAVISMET